MKDIKEKPAERVPKSNVSGKIPKAALKKAWTEAKEKSRNKLRESTSTQGDGDYTAAQDTGAVSAPNRLGAARCQMQTSARAVGQICPASGRKRKSSPPRPRCATFAA